MGWKKKLRKAKKLHRPSLRDWECDGLYGQFPAFTKSIAAPSEHYRSFLLSSHKPNEPPLPKNLPMILDARTVDKDEFTSNYEAKEIPCVIKNIPYGYDGAQGEGERWAAIDNWLLPALDDSEDLRERVFKCGEDDDGHSIKIKLKYFLRYLQANRDDSPLYIFDSGFDEDRRAKSILRDYRVPCYFDDDLFRLVSESRRPPYRWFLVGPERSGTCVHIDPLATNAWNTLIEGQKRWVLFPPHVPKHIVKGRGLIRDDEDDEAIHYFMFILPRIKRQATALRDNNADYRNFACYEFTQHPGETVFVPNGWWHAVLNLTPTVGVTQNYCSPRNFDKVWLKTRSGRKRMAWKWLCALDVHHPDLAARARQLNQRDKFRMKYDPAEMQHNGASSSTSSSPHHKQQKVV